MNRTEDFRKCQPKKGCTTTIGRVEGEGTGKERRGRSDLKSTIVRYLYGTENPETEKGYLRGKRLTVL